MRIELKVALVTSLIGAVLAWASYTHLQIQALQSADVATGATRFTESDAAELRGDLTDTLTRIDRRLSLIENDVSWIRQTQFIGSNSAAANVPAPAPCAYASGWTSRDFRWSKIRRKTTTVRKEVRGSI